MRNKKLLSLILAAAVMCSFAGCQADKGEVSVTTQDTTDSVATEQTSETKITTEKEKTTETENTTETNKISDESAVETVTIAGKEYPVDSEEIYLAVSSDSEEDISLENIEELTTLKSLTIRSSQQQNKVNQPIKIVNYSGLCKLKFLEGLELENVVFYKNDIPDDTILLNIPSLKSLKFDNVYENLYLCESSTVTALTINAGIKDNTDVKINLYGIEKIHNLKKLYISTTSDSGLLMGKIENYDGIFELSELSEISLICSFFYKNERADYEALSNITSLTSLRLDGCNSENWDYLSSLTTLKSLSMRRCNIDNIAFINNMPDLESLKISMMDINYKEACELVEKKKSIKEFECD